MIRLIEGGFYSEARDYALSEIKKLVLEKKRTYLLVPEQQTLTTESEAAALLPKSAPLCFEVTNFSRFANSAFRTLGGISREYLDRSRRTVLMWQTLTALSPVLNMTKSRREINAGTVDKAIRAVVKMQSCAISPEMLSELENEEEICQNGRLRSKISDLALIMAHYRDLLKEKYNETGDDVSELCALMSENPDYLRDTDIFFEGFTSFTEPQYKLIELLAARARVHVVLTVSKIFADSVEYSEVRGVEKRLTRIANLSNTELKLKRIDSPKMNKSPLLREYCELLWQSFGNADLPLSEECDTIRIFEGQSPYDAADFLAADIRRRVENGARFFDFAVICRDTDAYSGILSSALEAQQIPAFLSAGRDIGSFEAIKLINSAYRVLSRNFDSGAVLSYAKCSLCGVSRGACDEFEEYIHTWQLNNTRFYDGVLWNASPRGLVAVSEEDKDALLRINATREKICEPLLFLGEEIRDAKTVGEHARALFAFLNKISLQEAIAKQNKELLKIGEQSLSEDNSRLFKIICDSLDMLYEAVGDMEINADGFLNLLSVAFSAGKVSKIPSHVDEITIGSADMIRLSEKKHIYLFGVNSGEFPQKIKDNSYFTEREKLTISNMGLMLAPESELEYSKELFSFSRAFSYANESVTLLYTKSGTDFSKTERAPVIERLVEISGGSLKIRKINELSALDFIHTEKSALSSLGRLSKLEYKSVAALFSENEAGELWKIADTDIQNSSLTLSKESLAEIYKGEVGLSQSRLEKYNSCPLMYFCSYNLGLDNSERASFDASNIGSFIHSILENFFTEVKEKGYSIKDIDLDRQEQMVRRHAGAYVNALREGGSFIETKRAEIMIERLTKSTLPIVRGLCQEFSACDFVPTYFELGIGKGENEISPSAVTYQTESGRKIRIAGIIDRVDTFKKDGDVYVRVVDYKTGQKDFSPSDLENGENLQMFLYLKAICDTENQRFRDDIGLAPDGRLIPAGVIYVKTDLSDSTVNEAGENEVMEAMLKKQSRKGMILNDEVSIGAMNKDYIPIRFTKNGALDKRTEKNAYTIERWNEIQKTVEKSVKRIFNSMESGDVSPRPTKKGDKSPCEYCPYKPICRNGSEILK